MRDGVLGFGERYPSSSRPSGPWLSAAPPWWSWPASGRSSPSARDDPMGKLRPNLALQRTRPAASLAGNPEGHTQRAGPLSLAVRRRKTHKTPTVGRLEAAAPPGELHAAG